ncbi:hypothetical protein [Chryseobacterium sp. CCH4-E10]|uniref:hypothetical protein n=1 Tax=Chryseobacterium sp. CCH4-E10 TaxID=1768758 RepID=UPI000836C41E|nr:hypothetical protein [Chryseobacterium sp. CCH4-E10]
MFIQKILGSFDAVDEFDLLSKLAQLKGGQKKLIVLDDLIELGQNEKIDSFFNTFIRGCIDNNIFIISTSNYKIHNNIKSIHNDFMCEKEVILLSEQETLEIIESYPKSNDFNFKDLIYIITKGYPVYTQVICRYLDDKDWVIEEDQLMNFFTGNLFTDLTNETVKKVINKIQDEDTRNLLYRLNVIITNISDKEIKIVADCSPNINNPEEKISSLIGTWVQQVAISNYSISPLIKRLGTNNISESTLLEINFRLGKSILDKGSLSQIDVFNSIMYLSKAEKFEDAGFVLMSFLQHTVSKPEYFYRWNFDLLWFTTDLPNKMSLQLRLFIRTLHLLLESNRETEDRVQKEYLRTDLEKLVDDALIDKVDVYFPSIILSYSYLRENGKKALKYFTYYKNSYTYNNLPEELSSVLSENINQYNDALTWFLLMDISDLDSLNDWFNNFEKSSNIEDFDREQMDFFSSKLFSNFILKEEKKDLPDWEQLLKIFKNIFDKANQLNLEIFKVYSIKRQIQIASEKLNDIDQAEKIFKEYLSYFTDITAIYLITDEIGRQYFYKGNKDKSLEYLSSIADIALEKYLLVQIDTYSVLAKIYGEKNKNLAQYYITQALNFAKDNIYVDELWHIKLIGETAISLYMNNKIEDSLKELSKGYELLLNSFENDDAYKNVQLRYGNIISYINEHFLLGEIPEKSETHTVPYRGFFENSNNIADLYNDEKLVIIITMLVAFFEEIKDKETAHCWATKAFDLQKEVSMGNARMLFLNLIGYKILEDKYDEAVVEQIEIFNANEKYVAENKIGLPNFIKNYSIDFAIIASTINPICFRLLHRFILNEITIEQIYLTIKNLLNEFEKYIEDKQLIIDILDVINNYPASCEEGQDLMGHINKLENERFGHVQFLGYIICSMTMKSKLAIEAHLVFKDMFKVFSGSINLYIIVPFLVEFWKIKIQEEPSAFKGVRKLEENLDKVKSLKNKLQIQAIFALISESLNYKLSQNDERWLKDYYDEY